MGVGTPVHAGWGIIGEASVLHLWCYMRRISFRDCPYCHSEEVYRSHQSTWGDLASRIFLLGPARCHGCMRRHLRPVFFPAHEQVPLMGKKPVPVRADGDDRKRSA